MSGAVFISLIVFARVDLACGLRNDYTDASVKLILSVLS
jgi:hypothetical protein